MRTTPNPGTYTARSWTEELPPCTSTFRSCARDKQKVPSDHPDGRYGLPGVYDIKDGLQLYLRRPKTYNFRGLSRDAWGSHVVGSKDKETNVAPGQYEATSGARRDTFTRSANFLSGAPRFPTPSEQTHVHTRYVASATPSPLHYPSPPPFGAKASPTVLGSSCMESRIPRFSPAKSSVSAKLGPGCYARPTASFPRVHLPPRSVSAPPMKDHSPEPAHIPDAPADAQ